MKEWASMKRWQRWRWRKRTHWWLGMLLALVLAMALALGSFALAQLETMGSSAQRVAMQLLPLAVQAGDLRLQLSRLRNLEAGLARARSMQEVQTYEERLAEQKLRLREQELRYASLLSSRAEHERFAIYRARLEAYLGVQQQLVALARGMDYGSAQSIETTRHALVYTFAGASQGSFAATAASLGQWQQDHAAAAQRASFGARKMVERMRGWVLVALTGTAMLALALGIALALAWSRAGVRCASLAPVLFLKPSACRPHRFASPPSGSWPDTTAPPQNLASAAGADLDNLRWSATSATSATPAKPASARRLQLTRVTAEDWDSF